jgi:MFS transporter, ACS family, hexuronate transporter
MKANAIGSVSAPLGATRPISWPVFVTVFFLGNVLLWADRSNFSIATAVWAKEYDWKPSTNGLMLSAFSLGYLVMQPVGGWIVDRVGPRNTVWGSMAGWSLWVLLTPIAPGILWVTATFRVLLGMFEAPYIPSSAAAVAMAVPSDRRRGKFSAFMQSGAQLGPAVGVFLAGLILTATGTPVMIFILFGCFGVVAAIAWWAFARRYSDPMPTGQHADTAEAKDRAAQKAVPQRKLFTSKALWPLYIGYFALPYCQYIFLTWLPQYLTEYRHVPLKQAAVVSSYPFLVAFLASNFAGWTMDWFASRGWNKRGFHRKFFIALGALTYASTTLIAATTSSTTLAIAMIVVANAGLAFYVQPYWTICTDIAPKQSGALSGLMNFFGIIGATISPTVSGFIAQWTGAFVAPLELAAAIMLVAAATNIIFFKIRPISELAA